MKSTASGALSPRRYEATNLNAIVFLIALSMAAIAALAWKEYHSMRSARSLVRSELQLQCQSLSSLLETSFESAEQTLAGAAYRLEYNASTPGVSLDLRRRLLRSPSLSDLRAYDANNRLSERAGMSGSSNTALPQWAVEDIGQGRNTGFGRDGDSIAFYRSARKTDGQLLGTVYTTLTAEYFQNYSSQNVFANTQLSFLVGPDSELMLEIGNHDNAAQLLDALNTIKQVDAEFGGHGSHINEIGDRLLVIQQLRNHPLRVVQITASAIVVERWRGGALYSLALAALIVGAAAMFITYLRRSQRLNLQLIADLHRMNLVIEQSPVPIVITGLDANIVYVNDAFTSGSGYAADEVIGSNPRRLQSGATDPATYRELWDQLVSGAPWRGILVNRRKNGDVYWEESFIAPLRNLQGKVTHYFAVKIDVSARRQAQERLLEAQAHLQASHDLLDRLSQHIPGVLFQFRLYADGHSTVPYASEGVRDVLGVGPDAGRDDASQLFGGVHPHDQDRFWGSLTASARDLVTWKEEFRVTPPGGAERWLSVVAKPMQLDDGGILWHGFLKDINDRKRLEKTIQDHDRDMNTILENSSVGIVFVKDRRQVWANSRMAELFGYQMAEINNQATRMLYVSQEACDELAADAYPVIALGQRYIAEKQMRHKSGEPIWMRISGKAVDPANPEAGSIWVFEDISVQKNLETNLRLAASVFTHAREGILITDASGTIVDVNETFIRLTGYTRSEALGRNPRMLSSGRQPAEFYESMWHSLIEKGHWYGEVWNRRKGGELYAEMLTISSVRDAANRIQNYVALFSDITPIKEHQQQLEHIAHYDALTNLPNRVLLGDRIKQAILQSQRRKRCLAVVFLDLDGFKTINDLHGHAAGDALLIAVSQHLQAALREGDTLARIGGDEFVAVLADLENTHDCEPILERMLRAAAAPVLHGDAELHVSASMGVTLYPQDGTEVDLLMRQADQAMYVAKQAGKHRYHLFDVVQDAAMRKQHESLDRIAQALEQDELALYFQPKVNIRSGQVVGVEALLRWRHPEQGLLMPGSFLPAIEDKPLSLQVGDWVIETALAQMRTWKAAGHDIPVSVNISALQLQQDGFAQRMCTLLAAFPEVRPGDLELEVLETSAFDDLSKISSIIAYCQEAGLAFALDDFGTGYSSLAYLKHLPVDTLKIDQSFVRDMLDDPNDLAIVTGVIGLSKAFGRKVIAEGVETAAHAQRLYGMGCDLVQGYGIAKPMPADQLMTWILQWKASAMVFPAVPSSAGPPM